MLEHCRRRVTHYCIRCVFQTHVQALEGIQVDEQVLLLAGSPLEDDSLLASCGISEHCTLEVAARLLGGLYTHLNHAA